MKFSIRAMDFAAYEAKKKNCTKEVIRAATVRDAAVAAIGLAQQRHARGDSFCFTVELRESRGQGKVDLGSLFSGPGHSIDTIGFTDRCDSALKKTLADRAKWKRQCAFFYRYSQGLDNKYEKLPEGGYTSARQRAFDAICWDARKTDPVFAAAIDNEDYGAAEKRAAELGFKTVDQLKQEGADAQMA